MLIMKNSGLINFSLSWVICPYFPLNFFNLFSTVNSPRIFSTFFLKAMS